MPMPSIPAKKQSRPAISPRRRAGIAQVALNLGLLFQSP
jgi:hypothetical protein